MESGEEKNTGFFQSKAEKIVTKVEKTSMDKFFVFFLILISISAVVLGFLQFKKNIEGPALSAYLNRRRGELMEKYKPSSAATEDELINRLKNQDSDLDGLDDWSEINVYGTSPYLSDTDNDGLSDREEITRGSNPNCPEGLNCSSISPIDIVAGSEGDTDTDAIISSLGEADLQTIMQYEQDLLSGKMTLDQLGINNPQLQDLFDQMSQTTDGEIGSIDLSDTSEAVSELKKLTPDQLRQELINRGMDQDTLNQIDDQTLLQMRENIINSYQ